MGQLFEIELRNKQTAYYMGEPHSHDYYELFFLLEGKRTFFLQNNMMVIHPKTFCVIPPFHRHKTEGGAFIRINVNISPKLLSRDEIAFLDSCAKKLALKMDDKYCDLCINLLKEASNNQWEWKNKDEYKFALTKSILYLLQKQNLTSVPVSSSADSKQSIDTLMLNIASDIIENYTLPLTRKDLCEKFFISKATLSERFKRTMNCSVMQYLLRVRIGKAREYLINTDKSMEEISELCGFASANYFGLVFKKATGISPLHYRRR